MDNNYPGSVVLSRKQIDSYMADGYIQLGKILDDHQLNLVRDEYDREIDKARKEGYISNLAEKNEQETPDAGKMWQVYAVSTRNIFFNRLVHARPMRPRNHSPIGLWLAESEGKAARAPWIRSVRR